MTDTKPPACIFCGGETEILGSRYIYVQCVDPECSACGPELHTPAEAVAAFLKPVADARRKALEEAVVAIKSRTHWQPAEGWADEEREGYANGWGDAETGFTEAVLWIMPAPDPAAPEVEKENADA